MTALAIVNKESRWLKCLLGKKSTIRKLMLDVLFHGNKKIENHYFIGKRRQIHCKNKFVKEFLSKRNVRLDHVPTSENYPTI